MEDEREFYEEDWKRQNPLDKATLEADMKEVVKYAFGKVLDVGCGDGTILNELLKTDSVDRISGIDVSERAIKIAKKKFPQIRNFIKQGSITKIPFPTGTFDVVICTQVIEHVLDTKKVMSEMRRVLKQGGLLLICTPENNYIKNLLNVLLGRFENRHTGYEGHIRYYSKKSLSKVLSDFNFKIEKIVNNEWLYWPFIPKTMFFIARKKN